MTSPLHAAIYERLVRDYCRFHQVGGRTYSLRSLLDRLSPEAKSTLWVEAMHQASRPGAVEASGQVPDDFADEGGDR